MNTKLSYQTGLNCFEQFRDIYTIPKTWPPNVEHVVNFISYLSLHQRAPATARLYVSAISYNCKIMGVPDTTQQFLITKVLEGMKRLKHHSDTRLPITTKLLLRIVAVLPAICSNTYEVLLFKAAYLLAFFGFFRVGE